jgi:hypothetical protein
LHEVGGDVASQQSSELLQPVNRRLLFLCIVFGLWSVLGQPGLNDFWIIKTKWWGLLVYILVHLGLAGMILRSTGLRLWSIIFCGLGLVLGEREVFFLFILFTGWHWRGFV